MSGIGGNDPTGYNYAAADTLKQRAEELANKLENQAGSRGRLVSQAKREFRGYYSEVFQSNAELGSQSRQELVSSLRSLAGFVTELKEAARAEDERREAARAWEERQREREESFWKGATHEVGTWLGLVDEDPPPSMTPEPAPQLTADPVSVQAREVPAPAGSSSTSSAVPEDLRSFQTGSRDLDDELAGGFSNFESALSTYETTCNGRWGTLTAQPLVSALNKWFDANEQDAEWAGLVADAFEAAGGSGVITLPDAAISAALAAAGVDAHRDDFTIEEFSAVGTPPTNGFADDPVNTATGNFLEPERDLEFAGAAASLAFTRMYNTLDDRTGVFGRGWSSIVDVRLEFGDEGAGFVMADGRQIHFPRAGSGWERGIGENYWLEEIDGATFYRANLATSNDRLFVVTNNAGGWWAFTSAGAWLGAGAGPGTTVTVQRNAAGQVTRLVHERGRFLDIEYAEDRLVSVHASDGRRVEYLYDDQRRLVGVATEAGRRTYRWNEAGLIDQVVAADGVIECENFYDEQHRVIRQLTPYGRSVRFAYLRGRVTSVSTDDGTGANTWIADRKGRVVGIIDSDGNRQSMAYDAHGNIVSATDRDGQVTIHAYDERGRKTRTVTPEGADMTYGYDEYDRVTTVVNAAGGVVEYEYADDVDRSPSVLIDPEGGRTELTWAHGLLQRVEDPEGVALTFTYDDHGELIGVTNAAGDTARMVRDHAGRVIEAMTPLGATTRYRYDAAGRLVSRHDPDGGIWRYEYGSGGKVTAVIDPTRARTEFEYGPHGQLTATIDPLGRKVTKDFDEFGNVSKVTLPDGAEWGFQHDALSRLRQVIDPAGGVWGRDYDVNGHLAATVDPTDVRTDVSRIRADGIATVQNAFEHTTIDADEFGRPIRVKQTDGAEELVTYDACGRPVELVDAEGGLTKIQRDRAGRVTAITTPAGRTTRYEYDACGRPLAAIDPAGARTTLRYDADSRVIARTNPVGDVTTIDYDAMGRVIREVAPGTGVARYRYDKLGRIIAAQDSRYGQRKFRYDAAGQLIKVVNGVGGVTRYEYDDRGRVINILDPLGGVTTRTYTQLDKVASTADPLGRTTTATYDAAGRQTSQTDPDGNVTEWVHDEAGRETGMKVNGRWVAQLARDDRSRTTTITDYTRDDAKEVTHTLTYNRLGQLIERATVEDNTVESMRWEYDADGARTALVNTHGQRIEYQRDLTGRITTITHPTLGPVHVEYDAAGRIRETRAADQIQTWEYADGFPRVHTRTDASGVSITQIIRDDQGRITRLDGPDATTNYVYDDACQLVEATTDGQARAWTYDRGGRLIRERTPVGQRALNYDAAGQLVTVTEPDGTTTDYHYDGQGRRISARSSDQTTTYTWDARGWLAKITEQSADGSHETDLWVNALGEVADVDGTELHWDLAAASPTLVNIADTPVLQAPGGLTGIGQQWEAPDWRATRTTDADDPWQALAAADGIRDDLPSGLGLTADGALQVAGLEWMGARAYDPASRGFLSVDPLEPVTGAGWSANPYSYAGNDPLHAVDPLGLAPISDAELQAYADGLQGPLASGASAAWEWTKSAASSAWEWTKNNWEYVAGGAAIVAGGVLMATGVGGPAGLMLISAGADTVIQKATTGDVNWGQVAVSGAFGAVGGAGVMAFAGRQAAGNAVEGAVENVAHAAAGDQPLTAGTLVHAAAEGAAVSTVTGGTMNKLPAPVSRLDSVPPRPPEPVVNTVPSSGKTFVVTPAGTAYDVPAGWELRTADNGRGIVAQHPDHIGVGNGKQHEIRIMEPNHQNPTGYSRYTNGTGQYLDPRTGKPGNKPSSHVPPEYEGRYLGWPE